MAYRWTELVLAELQKRPELVCDATLESVVAFFKAAARTNTEERMSLIGDLAKRLQLPNFETYEHADRFVGQFYKIVRNRCNIKKLGGLQAGDRVRRLKEPQSYEVISLSVDGCVKLRGENGLFAPGSLEKCES